MNERRLAQLDLLRGIAILLVLGRHPVIPADRAGALHGLASLWFRFGWSGVDLFFVLSGFLVGGLIFRELRSRGSIDVRRFLVRRCFKIWPSYYVYLAAFALLRWVLGGSGQGGGLGDLAGNVLNVQNYVGSPRIHTWSLAVEEHFYLLLPLVLLWFVRGRLARGERIVQLAGVPVVSLVLLVLCAGLRWSIAREVPYSHDRLMFPTHLRIDSLFFGVFLAYLFHFHAPLVAVLARWRGWLALAGSVLVAPMILFPIESCPWVAAFGFTMLTVGYGCLLVAIVTTPLDDRPIGRLLRSRPARLVSGLGAFSYPIYLWHVEVGINLHRAFRHWVALGDLSVTLRWLCAMLAFIVLSTALGMLMGLLIERPALAIRDRLFPSPGGSLGSLPASEPHPPRTTLHRPGSTTPQRVVA